MSTDPQRPIYHFTAPQGWLNDPNGLGQWGDEYHLFYQHNPHGAFHADMHWGHAVSDDLVRWRHLPIALAPTPGGPDEDGCWSGVLVDDGGVPTLVYSGNRAGEQRTCLATSADGLRTWTKLPENPVIPEPPPGLDLVAYRDHAVWREGEHWYQVMGAGLRGVGGTALLYRSADLRRWEYLHPLCVGDAGRTEPIWTGTMWECPDFFPLGDRHVLTIAAWDEGRLCYPVAMSGRYAEGRFHPEREHKLDYGDRYYYAPQSFRDRAGRRISFGWANEGRSEAAHRAAGWAGVMSLPRELRLLPDGTVAPRPIPALEGLRREHTRAAPRPLAAGELAVLEVTGDALEIGVELRPGRGGPVGLAVRRSPDGAEETRIVFDAASGQLTLERERSSLDETLERTNHVAPLALAAGEPLRLRVFLDRSIIEVFANDRLSITSRIYPTRPDSLGVAAFAVGAPGELLALDAWRMAGSAD